MTDTRLKYVRINRRFLDGAHGLIDLRTPVVNVSHVPKDGGDAGIGERGLPEYILTYEHQIPGPPAEPELYAIPHEPQQRPGEYWLKFPLLTVILTTAEEDKRFREQNPEMIEELEALLVY